MSHVVLALVLTLAMLGSVHAAPECDGGSVQTAKVRVKSSGARVGMKLQATRPGATPEGFTAQGLTLRVLNAADELGAALYEETIPADAFVPVRRGMKGGPLTVTTAKGQADTVAVKVKLRDVVLPDLAAVPGLRVELHDDLRCARTCVVPCTTSKSGRKTRCKRDAAFVPGDPSYGQLTGPKRKRPKTTSPLCGLSPDTRAACDPLIEESCLLPYPSSTFLAPDAGTPTGWRVAYGPEALPADRNGNHVDPADWNTLDGFSPGTMILALFPDTGAAVDLVASNVAFHTNFARSLEADHPTVLMRADTGERIPHFAEMDANTDDVTKRALIIRPALRLENGTRYLVAIRNLVDANGAPIQPRMVFRALRDGIENPAAVCGSPCGALLEARGAAMADVVDTLAVHGVAREDLILAWDFTTASDQNLTQWMVSVRDQAFALPTPSFTVDSVDDGGGAGLNEHIFVRIEGTFQAPLFMTADAPASRLNLVGGMPAQNGFGTIPYVVDVPRFAWNGSDPATPVRATLWGHGLLGTRYQIDTLEAAANGNGFVLAAVDMQGMAEEDVPASVLPITGNVSLFHRIPERLHQGILNHLLLGRLLADGASGFNSHPAFQFGAGDTPIIDTSEVYYSGGSQGGIFGLTIMGVAENFTRGFLAVPGANYSTLLRRAAPFRLFLDLLRPVYPDRLNETLLIALIQQLWDRAEPIGYLPHVLPGDLSDPPVPHCVLLHMSTCDSQVSNLATEIAVRSLGIPQVAPANRSFFDVPEVTEPFDGSALLEIDWQRCGSRCNVPGADSPGAPCQTDADCPGVGDPDTRTRCDAGRPPLENLIPPFDNGAHGAEGGIDATHPVALQVDQFLRPGGLIEHFCSETCDPA
jgi:hypothetical protein